MHQTENGIYGVIEHQNKIKNHIKKTPCDDIYNFKQNRPINLNSMISSKRRSTNPIKPTSDKNETLYPYPYFI